MLDRRVTGITIVIGFLVADASVQPLTLPPPSPHIHVGAWKEDLPMQIRWDLRAHGALRRGR